MLGSPGGNQCNIYLAVCGAAIVIWHGMPHRLVINYDFDNAQMAHGGDESIYIPRQLDQFKKIKDQIIYLQKHPARSTGYSLNT